MARQSHSSKEKEIKDKIMEMALLQNNFIFSEPAHRNKDDDGPMIVLLGWLGCKDRWLAKYSDFLDAAGYPTIRAICPPKAVFWPSSAPRREFAINLLNLISLVNLDGSTQPRPVVFYIFSNGGGFIIEEIAKLLNSNSWRPPLHSAAPLAVAGVIFDSAPCFMHISVGARAIGEGKPLPIRIVFAAVFLLAIAMGVLLHPFNPRPADYWNAMKNLSFDSNTRYLYLYSSNDHLCDPIKLEQLIAARKALGFSIEYHRWDISEHVGHLRQYENEYTNLVLDFIEQ